jgi:hypothetical protein
VTLWQTLCDPRPFERAIARLVERKPTDRDGELELLQRDGRALAKRLAREMSDRTWRQQPVARHVAVLDKPRLIVTLSAIDRVVHGAVADAIVARIEPQLPGSLYSYRRGRGPKHVQQAIATVLARARAAPVMERGVFAVRFDVASYGDSIPIDDTSELWPILDAALPGEDAWMRGLLRALIRCDGETPTALGIPNGSPLSTPLLNLYLADLDRALEQQAMLYLRYGDDCMIACATAAAADACAAEVERVLARKRLRANEAKLLRVYWNGAGRPGPGGWRGATHVGYVGTELGFDGVPRAKRSRRRELMTELAERIDHVAGLVDPAAALPVRAAAMCASLRGMFDPSSAFTVPALASLLALSSDRLQLRELDRAIAIAVASKLTGRTGPSAFRVLPWRELYALGLPSLVALRNRGWRRA